MTFGDSKVKNWTIPNLQHQLKQCGHNIDIEITHKKNHGQIIDTITCSITTADMIKSSLTHSDNFRAEMLGLYLRHSHNNKVLDNCFESLRKAAKLRHNTFMDDASGPSRKTAVLVRIFVTY